MKRIDDFLNLITMYRLTLYILIFLLGAASVLGLFSILPFSFSSILFSSLFLVLMCWASNKVFSFIFKAQTNVESNYITALILALIVTPAKSPEDFLFLGWVTILAMGSKYILTINKRHIFNPAALAVVITAFVINKSASWWVGTFAMMPFVLVSGLLIVRKIKRMDLVLGFMAVALFAIYAFSLTKGLDLILITKNIFVDSPFLFFAFIMLTEPLTTPPTKSLRIWYGALVGFLFTPQIHFGSFYTTPEIALVAGNVFSYAVSPKVKVILKLVKKIQIAPDIYDFIFAPKKMISFIPGQYLEWTFSHPNTDSRGNRRYFTLASSPTEPDIRLGIKFYEKLSSFKKSLFDMDENSEIVASQLAGDFTMPKNPTGKYIFISGGIGVTPFRSIIKYLLDTNQKADIIHFFCDKIASEIVYKDVFTNAEWNLGIKTVSVLTDETQIPANWQGRIGRLNKQMIKEEVPDYLERIFYLSGPRGLVTGFENVLKEMGIRRNHIKTDFFPGFV